MILMQIFRNIYNVIIFSLALLTSSAPLQIDKCTPWCTCTPGWEPLVQSVSKFTCRKRLFSWRLLHTSNTVFKNVPPLVILAPPYCDILATALEGGLQQTVVRMESMVGIWSFRSVVLNLGFANPQGFTGRFPGVLGWQLSFHVLLFLIPYSRGKCMPI